MRSLLYVILFSVVLLAVCSAPATAQNMRWVVGGHMGLSVGDGNAGLQIGPMAEAIIERTYAVGTEFNINTQSGTPIEWPLYFKYYFRVRGSKLQPYANGGFSLWFYTGGPYFGLRFGGGVNIPVARNLYAAPDVQFGPVFATGNTVFYFTIRGAIRYYLRG
jgi:hypothetical protein